MGEPGFHVRLVEPTAPKRADGQLDTGWHSMEGWLTIQEQAWEEQDEVAITLAAPWERPKMRSPPVGERVF